MSLKIEENSGWKDGGTMKSNVKRQLLGIARESVEYKLDNKKEYTPDFTTLCDEAFDKKGVYVVLLKDGYLRSMAGFIEPYKELYHTINGAAINAACYNSKYKRLTREELPTIVFEISLISDLKKMPYSDPGDLLAKLDSSMGLMLKEGIHKATFLPSMWKAYADKKDFVSGLCKEAGLNDDVWIRKQLDIYSFKAETFADDDKD